MQSATSGTAFLVHPVGYYDVFAARQKFKFEPALERLNSETVSAGARLHLTHDRESKLGTVEGEDSQKHACLTCYRTCTRCALSKLLPILDLVDGRVEARESARDVHSRGGMGRRTYGSMVLHAAEKHVDEQVHEQDVQQHRHAGQRVAP